MPAYWTNDSQNDSCATD